MKFLRIRWPQNSCEILPGFDQNSSRNRWPRNSHEILQGFLSEFWWPTLESNNSDDYRILQVLDDHRIFVYSFIYFDLNSFSQPYYPTIQITLEFFGELYDHRIIVKFVLDLIRILQEIDDHAILMKFFKDFYQNSGGQS